VTRGVTLALDRLGQGRAARCRVPVELGKSAAPSSARQIGVVGKIGRSSLVLVALVAAPAARAQAIDSSIYDPVAPGDEWVWVDQDLVQTTKTILETPGVVDGHPTLVDVTTGGPSPGTVYETNDESGVQLYEAVFPPMGSVPGGSITFHPPLALMPAIAQIGDRFGSSGYRHLRPYGPGLLVAAVPARVAVRVGGAGVGPVRELLGGPLRVLALGAGNDRRAVLLLRRIGDGMGRRGVGAVENETDGPNGTSHDELVSTNLGGSPRSRRSRRSSPSGHGGPAAGWPRAGGPDRAGGRAFAGQRPRLRPTQPARVPPSPVTWLGGSRRSRGTGSHHSDLAPFFGPCHGGQVREIAGGPPGIRTRNQRVKSRETTQEVTRACVSWLATACKEGVAGGSVGVSASLCVSD
jgi:hypothetical protein